MKVKDLWTTEQAIEELGISRATIHRWMNDGELPFFKLGRKSLFKPEDVLAMLKPGGRAELELPGDAELEEALKAFNESDSELENSTHEEIKQMAAEMLSAFKASRSGTPG
jgi:excisionase family DNA binding protein